MKTKNSPKSAQETEVKPVTQGGSVPGKKPYNKPRLTRLGQLKSVAASPVQIPHW